MCVLVVPDELKALQEAMEKQQKLAEQQKKAREYSKQFENFWSRQAQDEQSIVVLEKEQDRSFLEMIRYQPLP